MKKVLYLDLGFHLKTCSSRFVYELLEEYFQVDKCFVDLDGRIDISKDSMDNYYEYLVLWQVMPKRKELEFISYGKGILFPMFDNVINKPIDEWNEYKDFTIISFCKTLHNYLVKKGFDSKYIQYFPKPLAVKEYGDINSLFFWQRTKDIHVNQVLSLCKNLNIKKVHIHKALDPNYYYIDVNRRFKYDFSYSKWLPQKSDLEKIISMSAYYIAPRKYEGIGMSFLEAMAMGRCVIAPNYPTMNEYINSGVNGILYDYIVAEEIDLYDVRKLQKNAFQSVEIGYQKWINNRYHIIEWIEEEKSKAEYVKLDAIKDLPANGQAEIRGNKYYLYYSLMNKWMLLKNRKISLESWFIYRSIYHIAIYGYSEIVPRLVEELENTSVYIDCYIDKEKKWAEDGRKIITIDCLTPTIDMIVVASFFYYDEIKRILNKRFSVKIVSLKDIVDDLIKEL